MAKVISQLPSGGSVPKHNNLLGLNEGDYLHLTQSEKAKLDGIQSGAEVNVNADWNAVSGDAQILNKPASFPPSTHTHTISEVINLQNELNSKENISNKVNTISGNSSTEYPTEKAVVDYVSSQIGADFAKVVYFDNVTPNVASIFDLNNPPLVNDPSLKEDVANLYIGTDASTWVYITSPAGYVTKTVTSSGSNFYITGTNTDAGSIKTGSITKKGQIVIDSEVVNDSGLTLKKTESSILKTDSLGKVVKATNLQDVEYAPIVHTHTVSQITDFPTFKTIEGQSVIGAGNIDLDKNSVGLGNVDNTSDLLKPISTATQIALNTKESAIASGTISQYWRGDKTWQSFPAQATVDQTIIDGSTNAVSGNAVFDGLALKAPLASPSLTGTPTAPTAAAGTNTTQIATTAFVTTSLESVGFTQIADGSNVVDFTIDGKQARVTTSSDYSINGNPKKLAIFLHYYGGNYTILPSTELKNSLLENGYSIATMSAGENWGNEQAQQLYAKLYNYVIKKFNVDKQPIAVSSSMGTLVSLNLINRNIIPFRALVSTVGVVNLSEYYGRNSEVSAGADIRTAYGFTNLVDAEKAFLGFDPYTRLKYNFGDSMFKTSCPIYFINGEIDTSSPIEYTQKIFDGLKRDYSNSVLEIVAGVGHDQEIVTAAIANKVISWLSSNTLLSTRTLPEQYVSLKTNKGFEMIDNTLGDEKFNYIEFKKKDDTRRGLFGYLSSDVNGANGMSWTNEQGNIGIYGAFSNRVSIGVFSDSDLGIVTNVLTTDLLSGVGRVTVNGNLTATNYTGGAALIGTPTAPTAPAGTNTTQIATTAFVNGGLATKENAFSKNTAFNKPFGTTAGTVVEGNDSRLSDSRTPTAGSNSYIQNQNTSAQSANMWISGNSRLTSVKANGRFYSIGNSNYDDLVSTTGAIIMSYDSVNTISNITSRNYSTSTSLPLQFEASSYSFLNGAATFASSVTAASLKLSALNTAPASATATGTTGEIRVTATHIYVCTATNTWVRTALTTW